MADEVAAQFTPAIEQDFAALSDESKTPPTSPTVTKIPPREVTREVSPPSTKTKEEAPRDTRKEPEEVQEFAAPTEEDRETGEERGEERAEGEESTEDITDPQVSAPITQRVKEINQKYPKLFKEYPELRDAVFVKDKFEQIFPTVEDAAEAKDTSEVFDTLRDHIFSGRSDTLLQTIAQEDGIGPQALQSFSKGFLPSLYKINPKLYLEVTLPVLSHTLREVLAEGTRMNNKNVIEAAKWVSHTIFGTAIPPEEAKEDPTIKAERAKLDDERKQFFQTRFNNFSKNVNTNVSTTIRREILAKLPKELTPTVKDALTVDILKKIAADIVKDPRTAATLKSNWDRASKAGYTSEWEAQLINAYLGRARNLLPQYLRKVQDELKPPTQETDNEEAVTPQPRKRVAPAPAGGSGKGAPTVPRNPKSVDWRKSPSDFDILNGKPVVLRGR